MYESGGRRRFEDPASWNILISKKWFLDEEYA
jgi:hypothetical protein